MHMRTHAHARTQHRHISISTRTQAHARARAHHTGAHKHNVLRNHVLGADGLALAQPHAPVGHKVLQRIRLRLRLRMYNVSSHGR